eukprot:Nk52_evm57s224 gene=Nk52_evmTU57s224
MALEKKKKKKKEEDHKKKRTRNSNNNTTSVDNWCPPLGIALFLSKPPASMTVTSGGDLEIGLVHSEECSCSGNVLDVDLISKDIDFITDYYGGRDKRGGKANYAEKKNLWDSSSSSTSSNITSTDRDGKVVHYLGLPGTLDDEDPNAPVGEGSQRTPRPEMRFRQNVYFEGLKHESLFNFHSCLVFFLTFVSYVCFHASRRPITIVKAVLNPPIHHNDSSIWPLHPFNDSSSSSAGWAPFDGDHGNTLLGWLDTGFLLVYAFSMFVVAIPTDLFPLRRFLVFGMIMSGSMCTLFGMGYFLDIHSFVFYFSVSALSGIFQAIGWPCLVKMASNWFKSSSNGFFLGVWSANAFVGNIVGSVVSSLVLEYGWGYCFVGNGILLVTMGILAELFLVAHPNDIGLHHDRHFMVRDRAVQQQQRIMSSSRRTYKAKFTPASQRIMDPRGETTPLLAKCTPVDAQTRQPNEKSWWGICKTVLKIPGVIPYSCSIFFCKLVVFSFLYWLPYYIHHTDIGGHHLSPAGAGNLSSAFDIGGILGGVIGGAISDFGKGRALTTFIMLSLGTPLMYVYHEFGDYSIVENAILLILVGVLVNGPYSIITTAVSADLGHHSSLMGQAGTYSKYNGAVAGIIDGFGSLGSAIGPLVIGFMSTDMTPAMWDAIFFTLVGCCALSAIFLTKAVLHEQFNV